ncbi:MAG: DUF1918 domain-containing protein [Streptosporangiales bacterium]
MRASVGDKLRVHSSSVGVPDQEAEVLEVRGEGGEPPYWVRYGDGREGLFFPGPDSVVEGPAS